MAEKTTGESQEADFFRVQFSARTSEYVEEILQPHFGDLIRFVKEAESEKRLDSKNSGDYIGRIITSFNSKWKNSLDGINKEVLNSFPNFKNGSSRHGHNFPNSQNGSSCHGHHFPNLNDKELALYLQNKIENFIF